MKFNLLKKIFTNTKTVQIGEKTVYETIKNVAFNFEIIQNTFLPFKDLFFLNIAIK